MSHEFISYQGIDVRILQDRRKRMSKRFGRRDMRYSNGLCHAHELDTHPILTQGAHVAPYSSSDRLFPPPANFYAVRFFEIGYASRKLAPDESRTYQQAVG
jgi:hypothetical protein